MPLEKYYTDVYADIWDLDLPKVFSDPEAYQRAVTAWSTPPGYSAPDAAVTEDRTISGPNGDIPIRIYRPREDEPSGLGLVWAHDGGWATGSMNDAGSDAFARELISRVNLIVVTFDYRLVNADIHYPVPLDDYVTAFRWVRDNARELGIDPARLVLGGGGSAATMSAGTALKLRDEGEVGPAGLIIPFPLMHLVVPDGTAEQVAKWESDVATMHKFNPPMQAMLWQGYLGEAMDSPEPYAVPVLGDLGGLPRSLIITSEYDYLAPSGEHFARQLSDAGVDVEYLEEHGVGHAHLNHPWTEGGKRSLDLVADWLR